VFIFEGSVSWVEAKVMKNRWITVEELTVLTDIFMGSLLRALLKICEVADRWILRILT
jgi:hypothetical protein